MNRLVYQEYFQSILNEFLMIDRELIPWKFTCTSCYYYTHFIHIMYINIEKYKYVNRYIIPIFIDTYLYISIIPTMDRKLCKCGLNMRISDKFKLNKVKNIQYLKALKLHYSSLSDKDLYKLPALEALDIGMYSHITNNGLKKLPNLRILYLRNNWNITKEIFKYLPHLHTIQIGFEKYSNSYCSISPEEIPDSIRYIILSTYDDIDCPYDDTCDPLHYVEIGTEFIKR